MILDLTRNNYGGGWGRSRDPFPNVLPWLANTFVVPPMAAAQQYVANTSAGLASYAFGQPISVSSRYNGSGFGGLPVNMHTRGFGYGGHGMMPGYGNMYPAPSGYGGHGMMPGYGNVHQATYRNVPPHAESSGWDWSNTRAHLRDGITAALNGNEPLFQSHLLAMPRGADGRIHFTPDQGEFTLNDGRGRRLPFNVPPNPNGYTPAELKTVIEQQFAQIGINRQPQQQGQGNPQQQPVQSSQQQPVAAPAAGQGAGAGAGAGAPAAPAADPDVKAAQVVLESLGLGTGQKTATPGTEVRNHAADTPASQLIAAHKDKMDGINGRETGPSLEAFKKAYNETFKTEIDNGTKKKLPEDKNLDADTKKAMAELTGDEMRTLREKIGGQQRAAAAAQGQGAARPAQGAAAAPAQQAAPVTQAPQASAAPAAPVAPQAAATPGGVTPSAPATPQAAATPASAAGTAPVQQGGTTAPAQPVLGAVGTSAPVEAAAAVQEALARTLVRNEPTGGVSRPVVASAAPLTPGGFQLSSAVVAISSTGNSERGPANGEFVAAPPTPAAARQFALAQRGASSVG